MKKVLLGLISGLLFSAVTLIAGDVSGKWTGTFVHPTAEGERSSPICLILKQDGHKLTGSGGPNETDQHPFDNGVVEDDRLTFEVPIGKDKGTIQFDLQVKGGEITGGMKHGGGEARETAKVSLKRAADK